MDEGRHACYSPSPSSCRLGNSEGLATLERKEHMISFGKSLSHVRSDVPKELMSTHLRRTNNSVGALILANGIPSSNFGLLTSTRCQTLATLSRREIIAHGVGC